MQNGPQVASSSAQGIVLADGYVLPPPPTVGLAGTGVWREDSKLVMSKEAVLPDRCVKCNEPAYGYRLKRKLSWHHPALYILIFVALLIYAIVAMVVRKRATVEIGLCDRHQAKRKRDRMIVSMLVVFGMVGLIGSAFLEDGIYALAGFALLIAGIIYGVAFARVVAPAKIDDRFVWLTGVNKNYLSELPSWPGV